jgi:hypothetical protein
MPEISTPKNIVLFTSFHPETVFGLDRHTLPTRPPLQFRRLATVTQDPASESNATINASHSGVGDEDASDGLRSSCSVNRVSSAGSTAQTALPLSLRHCQTKSSCAAAFSFANTITGHGRSKCPPVDNSQHLEIIFNLFMKMLALFRTNPTNQIYFLSISITRIQFQGPVALLCYEIFLNPYFLQNIHSF